jgi:hypothetical protein
MKLLDFTGVDVEDEDADDDDDDNDDDDVDDDDMKFGLNISKSVASNLLFTPVMVFV